MGLKLKEEKRKTDSTTERRKVCGSGRKVNVRKSKFNSVILLVSISRITSTVKTRQQNQRTWL